MKKMGILCGIGASAIWGGMYVVSKVVLEVIPPFALITLRLLLGIAILGAIVLLQGGLKLKRGQLIQVLGVGLMGYGISLGFQFIGTRLSTASNGALITSSTPALC
jgi:drug/metabolite transporter (DMT)-like permease